MSDSTDEPNESDNSDIGVPTDELKSLNTGVEEVRRRYDQEENRSDVIETKASALLALNAIVVSIVTASFSYFKLIGAAVIVLSVISSILTLMALRIHDYKRPLKSVRHISRYMTMSESKAKLKMALMYIKSTEHNESVNDKRYSNYRCAFYVTGIAILLLAISPIVVIQPEAADCLINSSNNSTAS